MNRNWYHSIVAFAIIALLAQVSWAQPTPGFNTKIPESVLTPDTVKTKLGTLKFFDGIPDEKAAAALFANLDLNRGLQTYLNGMPASNFEAGRAGHIALGQEKANQAIIFDGLMDSNSLFLTGNAGTVYFTTFLDLERDGPTVVEIPAGTGPGIMIDSFSRNVVDMGPPGPHRRPRGEISDLAARLSRSRPGWARSAGCLHDCKVTQLCSLGPAARVSEGWQTGLFEPIVQKQHQDLSTQHGRQIHPRWSSSREQGKDFNTVHAANYHFFEELHTVIDREPLEFLDPELRGLFASIGIQKGKPFAPDARMKRDSGASREARQCDRTRPVLVRTESRRIPLRGQLLEAWHDRQLARVSQGSRSGRTRYADARAQYFYMATFNSPAMVWKLIGRGSQYAWGYLDSNGRLSRRRQVLQAEPPRGCARRKIHVNCGLRFANPFHAADRSALPE